MLYFSSNFRSGFRRSINIIALIAVFAPFLQAEEEPSTSAPSSTVLPEKQPTAEGPSAYKKMSLAELMDQDVSIVTKTPEKLSQSPSAVQVLTGEDIRRSGALTLPDALRLAPNLEVQQVNSYTWVVSARGFDTVLANKLLVMIDGRTVYSPLDAGVFWDAQNVLLEDVDRIEVVSGPGGALWGANAVNGVINIVTKSAKDTQGVYLSAAAGSLLQDHGAVRYGGQVGKDLFYRVYAQRSDFTETVQPGGEKSPNAWDLTQGGFRVDYLPEGDNKLTVQGDVYDGKEYNTTGPNHSTLNGENLLGRWTHTLSEESDLTLQLYFDRTWRKDVPSTLADELDTYDFDFQHRFAIGDRHNILWGVGYRLMEDHAKFNSPLVGLLPEMSNMQLFSTFVQDEITIVPDRLKLTLGSKFEHNDFSGFEFQPSGRLAWTPTDWQTIWGAVSRAVRSPSRIDRDYFVPKKPPFSLAGGPEFDSETVLAYEIGYRVQATKRLSLSLATFYNDYDDLFTVEQENRLKPFPYTIQNGADGQSWGAEFSGVYQPTDWWRLRGGYTFFHKDVWGKRGHVVTQSMLDFLGNDPQSQYVLQSMMDLPGNFKLDLTSRYVDALLTPRVSSYVTLDARIAWQFKNWEFSVVGQNLLDNRHPEYSTSQEIPRSVYGKVEFRW
jgi:iron complex outermembrane receptor protein